MTVSQEEGEKICMSLNVMSETIESNLVGGGDNHSERIVSVNNDENFRPPCHFELVRCLFGKDFFQYLYNKVAKTMLLPSVSWVYEKTR